MVNLTDLRDIVVLIALISLVAAATAIALDDFNDDLTTDSTADNVTRNGLRGVDNATSFLDTTGTIAGVAVLIGIVLAAFTVGRR